jgi:hypothetical protein
LKEVAQNFVPYATALATSSFFRERFGNLDLMIRDAFGKGTDDLVTQLLARVAQEQARAAEVIDNAAVETYARNIAQDLQESLDRDDGEWKSLIPGKQVLNVFAGRANLGLARLKTAYIRAAEQQEVNPFQEIIDIFAAFNSTVQ